MPSTFWGLNIARSGLNAAHLALNTTSHNIANVNTKGYSRQEVNSVAAEAIRIYQPYGMLGSGVAVTDISRIRESYYDTKYWNNNQNHGRYEVTNYYMEQIQLHFNEFGVSTTGFSEVYNGLFNSLDELRNYASDPNYRNSAINHAVSLTEYFNNIANNLQAIQTEANNEIENVVERVNTYATAIGSINKQIMTLQMNGAEPNDLLDQRDVLVDELSKLVNIQVTDTVSDIGSSSYRIKINGQILVDDATVNTLRVERRTAADKRNPEDTEGLYNIKWSTGVEFDEYHIEVNGELRGYLDIRDGNDNQATLTDQRGVDYKGVPYYIKEINTWIKSFSYEFNKLHTQGKDLEDNIAEPFFVIKGMDLSNWKNATAEERQEIVDYINENITAYNCTINPEIVKNPYKFATAYAEDYDTVEGIDKQDLISDMVGIRDRRLYLAGTADDCFQGMISAIGVNTASAKSMADNFDNIGKAIENQRMSVSGVDEDEEAMDLVKYQAAYELAAKAMSVMSEILDKLINGTAV